jgi:hypothetical protein
MARRLSDIAIATRIVPTMLRWPSSEITKATIWDKLRNAVEALRDLVRTLDNGCDQIERDPHLKGAATARRRMELGDQTLGRLVTFEPVERCERAVKETINNLEPKTQALLWKALNELHEGVDAARRAVIERCQTRAGYPALAGVPSERMDVRLRG